MALARYPRYPAFTRSVRAGSTVGAIVGAAVAALVGMVVGGASVFAVISAFTAPPRQTPVAVTQQMAQGQTAAAPNAIRAVAGSAPDPSAGLAAGPPVQADKASEAPQPQTSASVAAAPMPQTQPAVAVTPSDPPAQTPPAPTPSNPTVQTQVAPPVQALQSQPAEQGNSEAASESSHPAAQPPRIVQRKYGRPAAVARARDGEPAGGNTRALYDYSSPSGAALNSQGVALHGMSPPHSGRSLKSEATNDRYVHGDRYDDRDRDRGAGGGVLGPFFGGNRGWND